MQKFVVYHIRSTMMERSYRMAHHASALAKKLNARRGLTEYSFTTREIYERNVVHMVERRNLQSGLVYLEASNTPGYMSPASEAYWAR